MAVQGAKASIDAWTHEELSALRHAVHDVPSSVEKQERWKRIAALVPNRGKRECYEKYKALKEEKRKKVAAAMSAEAKDVSQCEDDDEPDLDDLLDMIGEAPIGEAKACDSPKEQGHQQDGGSAKGKSKQQQQQGVRLGRGLLRGAPPAAESKEGSSQPLRAESKGSAPAAPCGRGPGANAEAPAPSSSSREERPPAAVVKHEEITVEAANALRELLFNDRKRLLPESWRKQGLLFAPHPGLGYGLVQHAGGPCGVLASVQAFVLTELLFPDEGCVRLEAPSWRDPSKGDQQRALVSALARMIWSATPDAGTERRCVVCLSGSRVHLYKSSAFSPDGVTERMKCWTLASSSARGLEPFLLEHLSTFTDAKGCGAALLLFSCIMSRGLEAVRNDMDEGKRPRCCLHRWP